MGQLLLGMISATYARPTIASRAAVIAACLMLVAAPASDAQVAGSAPVNSGEDPSKANLTGTVPPPTVTTTTLPPVRGAPTPPKLLSVEPVPE
jgi:hypothetical protein